MVSTSSPTRRSTSAKVRTVVVLPVPPFSDRTAIVSAIGPPRYRPRLFGQYGRPGRSGGRHGVHEVQRVAPDDDLVTVAQRTPFHTPPVDLDPVQGAVVEHAYAA